MHMLNTEFSPGRCSVEPTAYGKLGGLVNVLMKAAWMLG